MFLRPAHHDDHAALLELAEKAGFGMTTLPANAEFLREKIDISVKSFDGTYDKPGQESYVFVLVDPLHDHHVAGTCAIASHIGLSQPFYSYKMTALTRASSQLKLFDKKTILQVTNDFTGATEVCSLFIEPDYRRDRMGKLVSLSRFMFIAAFREKFSETVIAEMRGVQDVDGDAPFYNALPKKFFDMPFAKADYLSATEGNQFISDLMPKYPIYVDLLPKSARAVMGKAHSASEPAKAMLERQGFKFTGYIDIFDGGPTVQADRDTIDVVANSTISKVAAIHELPEDTPKFMVSNEQFADYRCAAGRLIVQPGGEVEITPRLARHVDLKVGDSLRYYSLA